MTEWKDYSCLKPLGNRILVKRLALPDIRESGLFIIGRDYPTMGHVLAVGNGPLQKRVRLCNGFQLPIDNPNYGKEPLEPDFLKVCSRCGTVMKFYGAHLAKRLRITDIHTNDLVQWSVDSNFDLRQIGRAEDGGDLFLFDYDDLNFVGREENDNQKSN